MNPCGTLLFFLLITLFNRGRNQSVRLPSGALSCLYLVGYSLGRVWMKGCTLIPSALVRCLRPVEGGLRIAQLMSAMLMLLGGWLVVAIPNQSDHPDPSSL